MPLPDALPDLVDVGANLTHESYRDDLPGILARAAGAGVRRLVVTGTSLEASQAALALSTAHPGNLWATAGIHPHAAGTFSAETERALRELLSQPQVVATGECGLDYFRDYAPRGRQRYAFARQLELAAESHQPVFLHQRDAHADFLGILRELGARLPAGVAHCFTEGATAMHEYLDLGLHIGITGWICDERRGDALREAVATLPLDRVLLETDAPYLLPRTLRPPPRSRRNEPAYLPEIMRVLAHFMGQPVEVVARASTANAERLFGLRATMP